MRSTALLLRHHTYAWILPPIEYILLILAQSLAHILQLGFLLHQTLQVTHIVVVLKGALGLRCLARKEAVLFPPPLRTQIGVLGTLLVVSVILAWRGCLLSPFLVLQVSLQVNAFLFDSLAHYL